MKAFSTILKNVNISIYDNCLTIFTPALDLNEEAFTIGLITGLKEFNSRVIKSINSSHHRHDKYHDESIFSRDTQHVHLLYPNEVTRNDLLVIGLILNKMKEISSEEVSLLMKEFDKANIVDSNNKDSQYSNKSSSTSAFGFRTGFFNKPQNKAVQPVQSEEAILDKIASTNPALVDITQPQLIDTMVEASIKL